MSLAARHYDNAADMLAGAHAVRMRLMQPKNAFKVVQALPAPVEIQPEIIRPLWTMQDISFDHHLGLWASHLSRSGNPKYVAYIRQRSAEADIPYETIIGNAKNRRVTSVRQDIMLGLRTDFSPPPAYAQIGRLMGGRDHSSCHHGAKAAAVRAALPIPVFHTLIEALYADKVLAASIKTDYLIGMTINAIGNKYHIGSDTIRRFVREMGWSRDPTSGYVKANETPKATQNQIAELYQSGLPLREIAAQCGVGLRTVGYVRKRLGLPTRPRK